VNTRLCPPLLPTEAAEVHRACLEHVCNATQFLSIRRRVLAGTPDQTLADFLGIAGGDVELLPQGDGDLGRRLTRCIRHVFETGADRVICIGTDSPTMPADTLPDTVRMLDEHDLVLGPCDDGGVYVIGLARQVDGLFDEIHWGGSDVAHRLGENAVRLGLRVGWLEPWYDLDRPDDLVRALHDLTDDSTPTAESDLAHVLRRVLEAVAGRGG
jgi:hypothetical protein